MTEVGELEFADLLAFHRKAFPELVSRREARAAQLAIARSFTEALPSDGTPS